MAVLFTCIMEGEFPIWFGGCWVGVGGGGAGLLLLALPTLTQGRPVVRVPLKLRKYHI